MKKISSEFKQLAQVVGTVHSPGSLKRALRLKPGAVDFLEIRVDHFAADPAGLLKVLPRLEFPLLVTVRDPAEGGSHALGLSARKALFEQFLPMASIIDVELRCAGGLGAIIQQAREHGVKVLLSNHHFKTTPSAARLRALANSAAAYGADIFKVAAWTAQPKDLSVLLSLMTPRKGPAQSVMGMGPLGKVSRLLFARAGSVLNYGYLDQPNASGQWEATELKLRIAELQVE